MGEYSTIGYNSHNLDLAILTLIINGFNIEQINKKLKINANSISYSRLKGINIFDFNNHIDMLEVMPNKKYPLEFFAARIGFNNIKTISSNSDRIIKEHENKNTLNLIFNELEMKFEIYKEIEEKIKLRVEIQKEFKTEDLRSKSDAQITEIIFKNYLKVNNINIKKNKTAQKFKYEIPNFIKFKSDELNNLLLSLKNAEFNVIDGKIIPPNSLVKEVSFWGRFYKIGMGGLHSRERNLSIKKESWEKLFEADVESYYPLIISKLGIYPEQLGEKFLELYLYLIKKRLIAKHNDDQVKDSLYKIIINGVFGKFGNKYSTLYSPKMLIQTTITGQLLLFMLMEGVYQEGGSILSVNTDGIVVKCRNKDANKINQSFKNWMKKTGLNLSFEKYDNLLCENVNNYIAIKNDLKLKSKGYYANESLSKSPSNQICVDAVNDYLLHSVNIKDTILKCRNINKFITLRYSKDGTKQNGKFQGNTIRFYKSTNGTSIYSTNGIKISNSDDSKIELKFNNFPNDVDYKFYINETYKILENLGFSNRKKTKTL